MARVLVIGAGVGGLAVAARLAAGGHEVTLCERADRVGGKLGTYEHGGFRFDTGPSLLTLPHVFENLFTATGAPLESALELVPVTPVARYRFDDGTGFDDAGDGAPGGTSGPAAHAWRRLAGTAGAAWPGIFAGVLAAPAGRIPTMAPSSVGPALRLTPWRSLSRLARSRLDDPRLRMCLERYATYAGADPRRASALLAVIPHLERAYGGWHIRGGLYRLAGALADRCAQLGVALRHSTEVRSIEVEGGRASGVLLADGSWLGADVIVANADATLVYRRLLPPGLRRRAPGAIRAGRPSMSGFALLLGVRGRTPGLAHHTVLFPANYHAEFDAIFDRDPRPAPDPAIYICAPDDPAMRPGGYESWFVLVNAAAHGTGRYHLDWTAPGVAGAYRDRLLHLLAARGLPVADRLAFCAVRTPVDLAREAAAPGGMIYGTATRGPARDLRRPPNRTPLPNLFLVGGSVHPGAGLPLVALSAAIVAGQIGPA